MCGSGPRFSAAEANRGVNLYLNRDCCLGPEPSKQPAQVASRECDASGSRRAVWPSHMQEHSAAAPGDAGPGVVVDLDDDVVEAVVAPEPVAWFIGRAAKWTIVAA